MCEGVRVARYMVECVTRTEGLPGVTCRGKVRTTIPGDLAGHLVNRDFTAHRPNALGISDTTCDRPMAGFVYVAFLIDAFVRFIVGWLVSKSLHIN